MVESKKKRRNRQKILVYFNLHQIEIYNSSKYHSFWRLYVWIIEIMFDLN